MKHVRNIKEMLNMPSGSRNPTSGYSSLPDSQLFFGSQFWLENSQGNSQDARLSSRNSQRSSEEGSEPKFSSSYHTKPLLFGDFKDKSRTPSLLEKFEEDMKKTKEQNDRDLLAKEFHHIRETLISIQQLVTGTEKNTAACQTVFEKHDSSVSALQNSLEGLQRDVSQKFELLVDKLSSHKEVMTKLEERMLKNVDITAELQSHLQTLNNSLESLREEHNRENQMMEEVLNLLNSLVSKHSGKSSPYLVVDSAIQTSPELEQSVSNNLQESQLEDCESYNLKQPQVETSLQVHRHGFSKRRVPLRVNRRKKRPLVPPKRSKVSVSKENSQNENQHSKAQNTSKRLHEHSDQNAALSPDSLTSDSVILVSKENTSGVAAGRFIAPLSLWSQDSDSSGCFATIKPILGKLLSESKMATPAKPGNLWELFDSDFDF